jgi:hypothetical protein
MLIPGAPTRTAVTMIVKVAHITSTCLTHTIPAGWIPTVATMTARRELTIVIDKLQSFQAA